MKLKFTIDVLWELYVSHMDGILNVVWMEMEIKLM